METWHTQRYSFREIIFLSLSSHIYIFIEARYIAYNKVEQLQKVKNSNLQIMIHWKAIRIPFLIFIIRNSLAWDGCDTLEWRCGDICIGSTAKCQCGGQVFNITSEMWCCQEYNCTLGPHHEVPGKEREIGANCQGNALHLTQARVAKLARLHRFSLELVKN